MIVTDLDGTLAGPGGQIPDRARDCLADLSKSGVVRVVATGRSLFGARRVLSPSFPIDYLIFSSGAGLFEWKTQTILRKISLDLEEIARALGTLSAHGFAFMVHAPIPDNHHFVYQESMKTPEDFYRRTKKAGDLCRPWDGRPILSASQFLVVVEAGHALTSHDVLRQALAGLQVIRATSPLDGSSAWLEIFPASVSKSQAAAWLARKCQIDTKDVLAIGNDHNDLDLLAWAGTACLVGDGVQGFPKVDSVCAAIERWLIR
jgi:HAD superfamily hydrolase (TIGR01484 family)